MNCHIVSTSEQKSPVLRWSWKQLAHHKKSLLEGKYAFGALQFGDILALKTLKLQSMLHTSPVVSGLPH